MRYQKFPPAHELTPFVECYFVWEGIAKEILDVQSPPNSFTSIVINYADPYQSYMGSGSKEWVPQVFASGQFTANYHLVLNGKIGMFGIVFKPSSLYNFFGFRMSSLVNSRVTLSLLLGQKSDELLAAIHEQSSDSERTKIIERFLMDLLPKAKSNLSIIDEAIDWIDVHRGAIEVSEVAEHFKISRRYLEKKFLEKVGVSPKFYSRLKRFTSLSKHVAYSDKLDWQELILRFKLHDQSHLIKEFIEFNQMNPTDYLKKHTELIRFLKR